MAAKERAIRRPISGRHGGILPSLLLALLTAFSAEAAAGQQPQRRPAPWTGATPPAPILGLDDVRPLLPLEFSRAWLGRVEQVRIRREMLHAAGALYGRSPASLARDGAALTGRLNIPVIAVLYQDLTEPFAVSALQQRLFGPGTADTMSFSGYWSEVSGGLLEVSGTVSPWIRTRKPARHYLPADHYGWSSFGRVVELRDEVLAAASARMDFRPFDNDGPDGIPDSGDDDGFVDFVALVYALPCPGDSRAGAIWPHRAAMPPWETQSIGANGEPIRIADYVVLPAVDVASCGPMQVGVLAHETGHALGLPDLYDYDGTSQGIGAWGLMGTGSHSALHSPAHLSAWEKEQLGWVRVNAISAADTLLVMPPVQETRTVYRHDGDDGDYLLLENRQRRGSDRSLPGAGLLIWHVDPERGELGAWNSDERRAALALVQADGADHLARGLRADAGDPFPGGSGRTAFSTLLGGGLQLDSILVSRRGVVRARTQAGERYRALAPELDVLRITALADGEPVHQRVAIHRTPAEVSRWTPRSRAGWLRVERDEDDVVFHATPAGLPAGAYTDTVLIRDAAGTRTLASVVVSFYVAAPGVAQVMATELPWSWGVAVHQGRILQASYGWDPLGLRPRPRVLQLREAHSHARTLSRLAADALYAPIVDPADGSVFVLARALDGNYLYQLEADGRARAVASGMGDGHPAYGAAVLADGDIAVAHWNGEVLRVSRDGRVQPWVSIAANVYQVASDHKGGIVAALYTGDAIHVRADGTQTVWPTGFGPGGLVTVTVTADGRIIAAERGGQGRIVRLHADGRREVIWRRAGARFYGLASDATFVYALDLTRRELLRFPLPEAPLASFAAR